MATRQELDMRKAKRIVKRIALRFDISPEDAKRFYFDRKESRLNGVNLPFYKWKKKNLNFAETPDGNDVETGDFDNFLSRKGRRRIRRKLRRVKDRVRGIARGGVRRLRPSNVLKGLGGIGGMMKRRVRKVRRHKGLLRKLANPLFMANPRNARRIARKVKRMAIGIKRNDDRLIRYKKRAIQNAGNYGYANPRYENFDNSDDTFLGYDDNNGYDYADGSTKTSLMDKIKKNKWLVVGGLAAFLFLTPMGKKLMKG
tara:strand:+ start:12482 stop:13249 length:768 start_codon:yes stop_codon:yes gene_type:complete